MDIKEEDVLGDFISEHWYYIAKSQAILKFLPNDNNSIADIGAGSGYFSQTLLSNNRCVRATCVDINYAEEKEETFQGAPLIFQKS